MIAPRRPTDIITTSSWRTGQQTVKRILGPAKKTKPNPLTARPNSSSSQDTDISEPKSLNFQWKHKGDNKNGRDVNGYASGRDGSPKDEVPRDTSPVSRDTSPVHEEHMNGLKKDSGNKSFEVNSFYRATAKAERVLMNFSGITCMYM